MAGLDLNVFTNFCAFRIEQLPIFGTLRSFGAAFGFDAFANIRVFCHAAPLSLPYDAFHQALCETVPGRTIELHTTRGLVDGYVRSLELSDAEYVFQLEHDYDFEAAHVTHRVPDIVAAMRTAQVPYLRFNIGPNQDNELDRITAVDMAGIPVCRTVIFSNRPHLLNRQHALQHYVPNMNRAARGSRGIEKELTARFHTGWIYGHAGHPPVIVHTDAYNALRAFRQQRLSWRMREFALKNIKTVREHFGLGRYGRIY